MPLDRLPFWTDYALEEQAAQAVLDLGRTLEPYHLLVRERCMSPEAVGLAVGLLYLEAVGQHEHAAMLLASRLGHDVNARKPRFVSGPSARALSSRERISYRR